MACVSPEAIAVPDSASTAGDDDTIVRCSRP